MRSQSGWWRDEQVLSGRGHLALSAIVVAAMIMMRWL